MSAAERLHAVVLGRVQGVGFRNFVRRLALELNLRGTVRNRPDGAVEVQASGPREALDRLLSELRRGAPGSRVSAVEFQFLAARPVAAGFEIVG